METRADCGSVRLYSRSGAVVTLPVTVAPLDYGQMMANVEAMILAGFSVNPPGLEAGEQRETVGFVVKGIQDDGRKTTPFILLYSADSAQKFSFLKVYLNDDEAIQSFEAVSGMHLGSIPQYIGQDKPERGKNRQVDTFIVPVRKPFAAVFVDNPKWSQDAQDAAKAKGEVYSVPKRKFVRWQGTDSPAPANGQPAGNSPTSPPASVPPTAPANGSQSAAPQTRRWHPTGDTALFNQHTAAFRNSQTLEELKNHWESFRLLWDRFNETQFRFGEKVKNDRKAQLAEAAAAAAAAAANAAANAGAVEGDIPF